MTEQSRILSIVKLYICVLLLLLICNNTEGQVIYNSPVDYYNVAMKRLLALSAGNYINQVTQGQVDPDSAVMMACQVYRINRLIPYSENYDGDILTPGMKLIDKGEIANAKILLTKQKTGDKLKTAFELGSYYLYIPGTTKPDLDSALKYIRVADNVVQKQPSKKWQNELLDAYGRYFFKTGDLQKSKQCFRQVSNSLAAEKERPDLALALADQATYLPYNDPGKMMLFQKSLVLCNQFNLKILEIRVRTAIATIYFTTSFSSALSEVAKVSELEKTIGFRHLQYVYNVLAYIYEVKLDYLKSLSYAQQSLKYMNYTGDKALSSVFYLRIATVLNDLYKNQESLSWLQKSLGDKKSRQTEVFWYVSFLQEMRVLLSLERFKESMNLINKISGSYPPSNTFDQMQLAYIKGECYTGLNQDFMAEKEFNLFLTLAKDFPIEYTHDEQPSAYDAIAELYIREGKISRARQMAQKSLELSEKIKSQRMLVRTYQVLFMLDSISANYKHAVSDLQKYKIIYDSINNTDARNKFDQLRLLYETEKKDRNILTLTKNSQIQNAKLKHSEFVKNIITVSVFAVSLVAALLFYLFRSKQKINLKLQKQQAEISEKNDELESLVKEKEWLVKEIHHRVKNNLHTIVSLLESQTAYLGNDALAAVRDSQHRIHAMSLIHQKLYLSDNVSSVNMSVYIRELVGYLKDSFKTDNTIHFNLDVEPIELDVSIAIPIGLILTEAITNSIKYAFDNPGGEITIAFVNKGASCFLTIADNGIGFSTNLPQKPVASLGMTLMKGLCKEIKAAFNIENNGGTIITVIFSIEDLNSKFHSERFNQQG